MEVREEHRCAVLKHRHRLREWIRLHGEGVFEDDLRFFATAHGITGTEHLPFKLQGSDIEHTVEHDPFKEGAQTPSACTSPHGFCSIGMESFV